MNNDKKNVEYLRDILTRVQGTLREETRSLERNIETMADPSREPMFKIGFTETAVNWEKIRLESALQWIRIALEETADKEDGNNDE